MSVRIERARPSDAPELARIAAETMQGAWSERSIGEEIARSHSEVAVAVEEEGGAIAGFSITWRVADEASLLLIAVRERAQRRGIGRRLLRAAERSAQDAGMGT